MRGLLSHVAREVAEAQDLPRTPHRPPGPAREKWALFGGLERHGAASPQRVNIADAQSLAAMMQRRSWRKLGSGKRRIAGQNGEPFPHPSCKTRLPNLNPIAPSNAPPICKAPHDSYSAVRSGGIVVAK